MSHFFLGDIIFDIANKERGVLVVKLGPSNFNYWKRTGKADSDISFFYLCAVGYLSEYRPFMSRPVIIGFRERRWLRDGKVRSSGLSVQPSL